MSVQSCGQNLNRQGCTGTQLACEAKGSECALLSAAAWSECEFAVSWRCMPWFDLPLTSRVIGPPCRCCCCHCRASQLQQLAPLLDLFADIDPTSLTVSQLCLCHTHLVNTAAPRCTQRPCRPACMCLVHPLISRRFLSFPPLSASRKNSHSCRCLPMSSTRPFPCWPRCQWKPSRLPCPC